MMIPQNWSNYAEFYKRSGYSAFPQEHRTSRGRLPFRMIHVEQNAHNFTDPSLPEYIIGLPLRVEQNCIWEWSIHNNSYRQISRAGSMLLVPSETESQWEVSAKRTILVLALPVPTVKLLLDDAYHEDINNLFTPLSEQVWEDPFVEEMIKRLWLNSQSTSFAHNRLSDGIITAIFGQLLLLAGTKINNHSKIAFPKWRLNRVKNYIEEHLSEEIMLENLAKAAGLSIRHFTRNFQIETGETPHKWMMRVRVEKAKNLLADTEMTINEIAQACGFSSQSHLTTYLKNLTGYTPLHWRHLNHK
ncbi:UNVERIFIED_ORG: AraC family transcriptional regulator [Rahnella aquatilis]